MKTLIDKYRLTIHQGPLNISTENKMNLDDLTKKEPFYQHHIVDSYDTSFPLDRSLPEKLDLYLLYAEDRVDMFDFLTDLKKNDSLFMVGIEGIIALGLNYNNLLPLGRIGVSPAYSFKKEQVLIIPIEGEANIPYFFKSKDGIGIGYSRTAASDIKDECILVGVRSK